MAAGALERSRRARLGSRFGARAVAKRKASGSPRRCAPAPRGRAGGRGRGRGRAAPGAACPRGRARGAAGRGAGRRILCSRLPPRPERAGPGLGGSPGGAAPCPHPQRALRGPQARRRYSGRVRSPDLPAEQGCPGVRARPPPPGDLLGLRCPQAHASSVPSSPGPPYPLPRPDPAAKGWAGKRALWDRCQLRDKRHKIGGNGGSAAGALGRGRRHRGGHILGADPGKFGKSPRPLRSGGGRTARAALRAALALSAPLLNNSWRGRRPLACTGRAARLCQAAAAFGVRAAPDERPRGDRARAVPAPAPRRPLCRGGQHGLVLPESAAARACPTARLCESGSAAPAGPPRDARELGESRRARRPGPPRQGVGAPGPARFRFRLGQRSPAAAPVADAVTRSCGQLFAQPLAEYRDAGGKERRGAWLCVCRRAVPPSGVAGIAPLCRSFRRGNQASVANPGLSARDRGPLRPWAR
ncbi:collagen alpha-2(I) chain [Sciurus carolinensis]|uniref:collagen alpha-2(I) chain n=1 Tax=Sciurus carolinensis TaxID=30640 RepID=UPI001FB2A514|nr:collagen alpha-2(I) chain [Sciurus carolinensis]